MISELFISLTLKKLKNYQHLKSLHLLQLEWFLESPADFTRSLISVFVSCVPSLTLCSHSTGLWNFDKSNGTQKN